MSRGPQNAPQALSSGAEVLRPLSGYSGCDVLLMRQGESLFVRKVSGSRDYNDRLLRQMQEQETFSRYENRPFGVPRIFGSGHLDARFYFDSQYVPSRDLISFISDSDHFEIAKMLRKLQEIIVFFQRTPHRTSACSLLDYCRDKVESVAALIEVSEGEELAGFRWILDRLQRSDHAEATLSHADLTLENILIDASGRLWLIDFLDSSYSHYWLSIAKTFQDLEGHWFTLRNHPEPIPASKLLPVRRQWDRLVAEIDPRYGEFHYLLLALMLFRIVPYAKGRTDGLEERLRQRVRGFLQTQIARLEKESR